MTIAFDITQFVHHPVASGIQRVLHQLTKVCGDTDRFTVLHDGSVYVLTPSVAESLIGSVFSTHGNMAPCERAAIDRSLGCVTIDQLRTFDAYVFAELSYESDLLDLWEALEADDRMPTGAIFYDAIPELDRAMLGSQPPAASSRYFRLVSRLDRVACISHGARQALATMAHRDTAEFDVAPLGGDHLRRGPRRPPTQFVVIGDLRAKKRVDVALAAFERVSDQIELDFVVIGRAIHGQAHVADLVAAAARSSRVTWIDSATDDRLAYELAGAAAGLFIATDEGFGLPALEFLHAGTPAVVDEALPALRYVADAGQIRLSDVTVDSVSRAMMDVADPDRRAELCRQADQLKLPTWDEFFTSVTSVFQRA